MSSRIDSTEKPIWSKNPLALVLFGRADDTVGNPHRAQSNQFELFELIIRLTSDKQLSIEQFEATVSRSTVSSPPS